MDRRGLLPRKEHKGFSIYTEMQSHYKPLSELKWVPCPVITLGAQKGVYGGWGRGGGCTQL